MLRSAGAGVLTFVLLATSGSKAFAAEHEGLTPAEAAVEAFTRAFPEVHLTRSESRITSLHGAPFAQGDGPESAAEQFRMSYSRMFRVSAEELIPKSLLADRRHTQPVMFDPTTGRYKFTLVYYSQVRGGLPVFRGELRLLVRNEPGHPVVWAGSNVRDLGGFAAPRAAVIQAEAARAAAVAVSPRLTKFTEPKQVIWAGDDETVVAPALAIEFVGESADQFSSQGYEKWLFVADALTGAILHREDMVLETDVSGNVSEMASEGEAAEFCENETLVPMPYARASIGTTHAFADVNGNYTIPNAGTTDVQVDSLMRGQRFIVVDQAQTAEALSQTVTPPGPANFVHNAANSSEFVKAEANAYLQANIVRDFALSHNPAYPVIATQTNFTVNVNININCNAFYSGSSINFYVAGGGCANSAYSSVVHHEYGHHLVQVAGSGQDQYGEGMGDCMSMLIADDPVLGKGFNNNCNAGIRNAVNSIQYPCGGEGHFCGQLISGCVWETRNALATSNPGTYRDIIADLTVNSILMHTGSSITPQIHIDFLTLDDDDANLNNGTPHCPEIFAGFDAHGMAAAQYGPLTFTHPTGFPQFVVPNQANTVQLNVAAACRPPIPGSGTISYRLGSSGPFTTVSMNEINPNEYEGLLPAAACTQEIQYYFGVTAVDIGIVNDPVNAPAEVYSTTPALGTSALVANDFQVNPGWTVSGSVVDGPWDAGPATPINCGRGDPTSGYGGSGQCLMTDNNSANGCNSDVDDGTTIVTSQIIDLTSLSDPRVSYARWYSNTFGALPQADVFVVEVSNNGGGSWVNLETVGPTTSSPNPEVDGGWFLKTFRVADFVTPTNQFRIRFSASDAVFNGSVVEAAIDQFSLFDFICPPPCGGATGNLDENTTIDGQDLQVFVDAMLGSPTAAQLCAGDFDVSSTLDVGDIDGMVSALLSAP